MFLLLKEILEYLQIPFINFEYSFSSCNSLGNINFNLLLEYILASIIIVNKIKSKWKTN